MPITAGTMHPIRALGGFGSSKAAHMTVVPLDPSDVFRDGDILVINATSQDMSVDNNPDGGVATADLIFGVLQAQSGQGFTAAATIDRDEPPDFALIPGGTGTPSTANVAVAFPGARFEGNLVGGADTDHTGVYGDDVHMRFGCIETTTSEFGALNFADTTAPVAFTWGYTTPQVNYATGGFSVTGRTAGVGLANPRMEFTFVVNATVFGSVV